MEGTASTPRDEWLVSILYTVMDDRTKTHCSGSLDMETNSTTLRNNVRAFITLVVGPQIERVPAPWTSIR